MGFRLARRLDVRFEARTWSRKLKIEFGPLRFELVLLGLDESPEYHHQLHDTPMRKQN